MIGKIVSKFKFKSSCCQGFNQNLNCVTMTFVQVFIIHDDSTITGIYEDSAMTELLNKLFQEEKQGTGAINAGT